jgi:hopanoid biosynthesis associated protein HpnK
LKGLIVTADDFGAAPEVNDAVEQAHRNGILTAASLMVAGPAASDAVALARRMPGLRVGLHLTLLEGRPVLPPAQVPSLVDSRGAFRTDIGRFGVDMFTRATVRRQVADEIAAQFEAYRATGLPLDHVNAHKHFHLHPTLTGITLRIGARYGMQAIRVPYEPRGPLRAAEPGVRSDFALDTLPWAILLRARAAAGGLTISDAVFGLRWSGAMTRDRLSGLIAHLPEGLSEIYLHPATGAFEGSAPGYRYRDERDALCDGEIIALVRRSGIRTGGYADFGQQCLAPETATHHPDIQQRVLS